MAKKNKKTSHTGSTIALNKAARHDYFIEKTFEAGIVLEGWEVKSLRAQHMQLKESYVVIKKGEIFLVGAHLSPLHTASTHIHPDPTRMRKLLLHKGEIDTLIGAVERKGYTLVVTAMYWKHGLAKVEVALAKGKKQHDKRASEKEKDWNRDKQRLSKNNY